MPAKAVYPPNPAPATVEEFIAGRTGSAISINDRLDQYNTALYSNEKYRRLLDGTCDAHCVEGSMVGDDYELAALIRTAAKEAKDDIVGNLNKATIVHSLRIVLRRYKQGRKQRRYIVRGESVPRDDDNGDE